MRRRRPSLPVARGTDEPRCGCGPLSRVGTATGLGTASFWEGGRTGDAPARTRDREAAVPPCPPAGDAARRAIHAGGGRVREYRLPHSSLRLKQGFWRLIRHRTDRGVVVSGTRGTAPSATCVDARRCRRRRPRVVRWPLLAERIRQFYGRAPALPGALARAGSWPLGRADARRAGRVIYSPDRRTRQDRLGRPQLFRPRQELATTLSREPLIFPQAAVEPHPPGESSAPRVVHRGSSREDRRGAAALLRRADARQHGSRRRHRRANDVRPAAFRKSDSQWTRAKGSTLLRVERWPASADSFLAFRPRLSGTARCGSTLRRVYSPTPFRLSGSPVRTLEPGYLG